MKKGIPQFSYSLNLSFNDNTSTSGTSSSTNLQYIKINNDNTIQTNSACPSALVGTTVPSALQQVLTHYGIEAEKPNVTNLSSVQSLSPCTQKEVSFAANDVTFSNFQRIKENSFLNSTAVPKIPDKLKEKSNSKTDYSMLNHKPSGIVNTREKVRTKGKKRKRLESTVPEGARQDNHLTKSLTSRIHDNSHNISRNSEENRYNVITNNVEKDCYKIVKSNVSAIINNGGSSLTNNLGSKSKEFCLENMKKMQDSKRSFDKNLYNHNDRELIIQMESKYIDETNNDNFEEINEVGTLTRPVQHYVHKNKEKIMKNNQKNFAATNDINLQANDNGKLYNKVPMASVCDKLEKVVDHEEKSQIIIEEEKENEKVLHLVSEYIEEEVKDIHSNLDTEEEPKEINKEGYEYSNEETGRNRYLNLTQLYTDNGKKRRISVEVEKKQILETESHNVNLYQDSQIQNQKVTLHQTIFEDCRDEGKNLKKKRKKELITQEEVKNVPSNLATEKESTESNKDATYDENLDGGKCKNLNLIQLEMDNDNGKRTSIESEKTEILEMEAPNVNLNQDNQLENVDVTLCQTILEDSGDEGRILKEKRKKEQIIEEEVQSVHSNLDTEEEGNKYHKEGTNDECLNQVNDRNPNLTQLETDNNNKRRMSVESKKERILKIEVHNLNLHQDSQIENGDVTPHQTILEDCGDEGKILKKKRQTNLITQEEVENVHSNIGTEEEQKEIHKEETNNKYSDQGKDRNPNSTQPNTDDDNKRRMSMESEKEQILKIEAHNVNLHQDSQIENGDVTLRQIILEDSGHGEKIVKKKRRRARVSLKEVKNVHSSLDTEKEQKGIHKGETKNEYSDQDKDRKLNLTQLDTDDDNKSRMSLESDIKQILQIEAQNVNLHQDIQIENGDVTLRQTLLEDSGDKGKIHKKKKRKKRIIQEVKNVHSNLGKEEGRKELHKEKTDDKYLDQVKNRNLNLAQLEIDDDNKRRMSMEPEEEQILEMEEHNVNLHQDSQLDNRDVTLPQTILEDCGDEGKINKKKRRIERIIQEVKNVHYNLGKEEERKELHKKKTDDKYLDQVKNRNLHLAQLETDDDNKGRMSMELEEKQILEIEEHNVNLHQDSQIENGDVALPQTILEDCGEGKILKKKRQEEDITQEEEENNLDTEEEPKEINKEETYNEYLDEGKDRNLNLSQLVTCNDNKKWMSIESDQKQILKTEAHNVSIHQNIRIENGDVRLFQTILEPDEEIIKKNRKEERCTQEVKDAHCNLDSKEENSLILDHSSSVNNDKKGRKGKSILIQNILIEKMIDIMQSPRRDKSEINIKKASKSSTIIPLVTDCNNLDKNKVILKERKKYKKLFNVQDEQVPNISNCEYTGGSNELVEDHQNRIDQESIRTKRESENSFEYPNENAAMLKTAKSNKILDEIEKHSNTECQEIEVEKEINEVDDSDEIIHTKPVGESNQKITLEKESEIFNEGNENRFSRIEKKEIMSKIVNNQIDGENESADNKSYCKGTERKASEIRSIEKDELAGKKKNPHKRKSKESRKIVNKTISTGGHEMDHKNKKQTKSKSKVQLDDRISNIISAKFKALFGTLESEQKIHSKGKKDTNETSSQLRNTKKNDVKLIGRVEKKQDYNIVHWRNDSKSTPQYDGSNEEQYNEKDYDAESEEDPELEYKEMQSYIMSPENSISKDLVKQFGNVNVESKSPSIHRENDQTDILSANNDMDIELQEDPKLEYEELKTPQKRMSKKPDKQFDNVNEDVKSKSSNQKRLHHSHYVSKYDNTTIFYDDDMDIEEIKFNSSSGNIISDNTDLDLEPLEEDAELKYKEKQFYIKSPQKSISEKSDNLNDGNLLHVSMSKQNDNDDMDIESSGENEKLEHNEIQPYVNSPQKRISEDFDLQNLNKAVKSNSSDEIALVCSHSVIKHNSETNIASEDDKNVEILVEDHKLELKKKQSYEKSPQNNVSYVARLENGVRSNSIVGNLAQCSNYIRKQINETNIRSDKDFIHIESLGEDLETEYRRIQSWQLPPQTSKADSKISQSIVSDDFSEELENRKLQSNLSPKTGASQDSFNYDQIIEIQTCMETFITNDFKPRTEITLNDSESHLEVEDNFAIDRKEKTQSYIDTFIQQSKIIRDVESEDDFVNNTEKIPCQLKTESNNSTPLKERISQKISKIEVQNKTPKERKRISAEDKTPSKSADEIHEKRKKVSETVQKKKPVHNEKKVPKRRCTLSFVHRKNDNSSVCEKDSSSNDKTGQYKVNSNMDETNSPEVMINGEICNAEFNEELGVSDNLNFNEIREKRKKVSETVKKKKPVHKKKNVPKTKEISAYFHRKNDTSSVCEKASSSNDKSGQYKVNSNMDETNSPEVMINGEICNAEFNEELGVSDNLNFNEIREKRKKVSETVKKKTPVHKKKNVPKTKEILAYFHRKNDSSSVCEKDSSSNDKSGQYKVNSNMDKTNTPEVMINGETSNAQLNDELDVSDNLNYELDSIVHDGRNSYTFADILSQSHTKRLEKEFEITLDKSSNNGAYSEVNPEDDVERSNKFSDIDGTPKSTSSSKDMCDEIVNSSREVKAYKRKKKAIKLIKESKSIWEIHKKLNIPNKFELEEKISDLVIQNPYPLYRIHEIAPNISRPPTEEQKRIIKDEGIELKIGYFSEQEDLMIKKNWREFCLLHCWDKRDYLPFLNSSKRSKYGVLSCKQTLSFVQFLSHGFENRTMNCIYKRFRKMFPRKKQPIGRFSKEDDEIILEYMKNSVSSKPYADIATILKRTQESILKRHNLLKMKNDLKITKIQWNKELGEELMVNLMEVTCTINLFELKNRKITPQEWSQVAKRMRLPAEKIKKSWLLNFYPRFFTPDYFENIASINEKLIDVVSSKYSKWRQINWNTVAKELGIDIPPIKCSKTLKDLVRNKVPSDIQSNLKEALIFLKGKNLSSNEDRYSFVYDILKETNHGTKLPRIQKRRTSENETEQE